MMRFISVCIGGAIGTGARYLLFSWVSKTFAPSFPYGTLLVNALGSFWIGFVSHFGLKSDPLSPNLRLFLTMGIMGGFTTYSTFNYETLWYFQEGSWGKALANIFAMLAVCLILGLLGAWTGRHFA